MERVEKLKTVERATRKMDLLRLTLLAEEMMKNQGILDIIEDLKAEIEKCDEPFIGVSVSQHLIGEKFPSGIQSAWIFVIKPRSQFPSHYHPNSIQHTAIIEGEGSARIGDKQVQLQCFNPKNPQTVWYVIGKNVPHQFKTGNQPVVVMSFHTCPANKLVEVETKSGRRRFYLEI